MGAGSLAVTSFLPYLELPSLLNGASVQLRETGGKITVLVTLHSADCPGCREYLAGLSSISGDFDAWDARLLAIAAAPAAAAPLFGQILLDEQGSIADPANASVAVADRYGQIFEAVHAGASHALPSPRELAEWLKYLGTLCPE